MTKSEYDRLYSEIRAAESRARKAANDAEQRVENTKAVADRDIRDIKKMLPCRLKKSTGSLQQRTKEIEYQRRLNENLLRINRERANSDRKLKPKKKNTQDML